MRSKFSISWRRSKQPRKQRKYLHNAPLHIRHKIFSVRLSKHLQKKYGRRNIPLRRGDRVKILKGQFKNKEGNVEKLLLKKYKVNLENIQVTKKDGTKSYYPIHPSNLLLTELNLTDRKRKLKLSKEEKNG